VRHLIDRFFSGIRRGFRHRPSPPTVAALTLFAVAFAVRLVWVSYIDSPFDNIFSDMAGYVNRALLVAYGGSDPLPLFASQHPPDAHALAAAAAGVDPWTVQCPYYPPGTHLVLAAEMKLVGWSHHAAMSALNCAWGAAVAPCAMLMALRIVPRLGVATVVGLLMAVWYPLLAFSSFFSSEQPYAGAIAVASWLLVRQVERGKSAVALGLAASVAYLVRPQIIVTLAALSLVGLFVILRRSARGPRLRLGRLVLAGAIFTATVAWGCARYHRLSGRWGLISDNGAMGRLGADTSYSKVRAVWHAPDGAQLSFQFESPPRAEMGRNREVVFDGYIGDPVILDRIRRGEVAYMSTGERVARWANNVRPLFVDGSLWPVGSGTHWRSVCYSASKVVLMGVFCPLALLGMISCARSRALVPLVCTAQVVSLVLLCAFFCGEQRYRMPYDVFLVLLALEGARASTSVVRQGIGRARALVARR
jgi:hypothetical protein